LAPPISGKGYRTFSEPVSEYAGVAIADTGAGAKPTGGSTCDMDELADERCGFMMLLGVDAGAILRCWMVLSGVSDMMKRRKGSEARDDGRGRCLL
jgi:hypothetical protein